MVTFSIFSTPLILGFVPLGLVKLQYYLYSYKGSLAPFYSFFQFRNFVFSSGLVDIDNQRLSRFRPAFTVLQLFYLCAQIRRLTARFQLFSRFFG